MVYMSVKPIIRKCAAVCFLALGTAFAAGNRVSVTPSQPTHYLYTPTARVNPPYHTVAGLHELSFALPGNLQIQASLIDNIGKTNLAAKYGLAANLAIGGGLASTLIDMGGHRINGGDARLGLFLAYSLADAKDLSMTLTPHVQISDRFSIGADFGLMKRMVDIWSILWEAGISAEPHDALYLYTTGALRLHFPVIPFMFFDIGVGTNEFNIVHDVHIYPKVFFDIMFCFIAK